MLESRFVQSVRPTGARMASDSRSRAFPVELNFPRDTEIGVSAPTALAFYPAPSLAEDFDA